MENSNILANEKIELNKAIFVNVKSKYILIKIFNNLSKRKTLDLIKYNKKI